MFWIPNGFELKEKNMLKELPIKAVETSLHMSLNYSKAISQRL